LDIKVYKEDPIIVGFVHHNLRNILFLPSEKNPPIEEQLYLFMKRFRTQPSEFFSMNRELRLSLYARELRLVKEEYESAKNNSNNNV
jgi:hypothetical protein